ncbi:MAG TPA: glycosyltransferase family 4 protein [Nitrosopumilaceae archaeon]|nr:glycosyltransferase family 4 protein [Nitrosopumilaceae archaeon]
MKILFIAPRYSGGIGGHANRIAEKLRKNGFDIKLMYAPKIPIKNLKNPSFAIFSSIKAILSREKFDVVHAFNVPSAFAMRYVNAKKKVLSIHGVYSDQISSIHSHTTSSIIKSKELRILKWADKLTTNSRDVQKVYKEKYGLDFEYLLGPIDIEKFKGIKNESSNTNENKIIYIGRDSPEKGIDILKSIEKKIKGKVVYCTNVEWKKAMSILKSSNVLVLPSRIESIPNVIKEAFFLKVPVVATNVGGIPEIVEHGKTGILVPPNQPQSLADSINHLLENKEFAKKLADTAYEFLINNFTWDILLPKYIKFYEDLIKE